jgi:hypothetical protein
LDTDVNTIFVVNKSKKKQIVPREQDKLEVVHGEENGMETMLKFLSRADKIDCCYDYRAPSMVIEVEAYRKLLLHIKERDIKLRFLTDIKRERHYINYGRRTRERKQ